MRKETSFLKIRYFIPQLDQPQQYHPQLYIRISPMKFLRKSRQRTVQRYKNEAAIMLVPY